MKVNYNCKENNAKLKFICEDGLIEEYWVKVRGDSRWIVVGYNDFLNGVKKAEKKCRLKNPNDKILF